MPDAAAHQAAEPGQPKEPSKAELWRSFREMIRISWQADPAKTSLAALTSIVAAVSNVVIVYLVSRVVVEVLAGDYRVAFGWAAAIAVTRLAGFFAGMVRLDLRFRLEEAVTLHTDAHLIEVVSSIPTIEFYENPKLVDQLDLLRQQRGALSGAIGALVQNLSVLVQIVTTAMLLATVHPVLVLLPLAGIPSVIASKNARARWKDAEEAFAELARRAEHFFEVATTAASAKEIRVFGLRDEVAAQQHDALIDTCNRADSIQLTNKVRGLFAWCVFGAGYIGSITYVLWRAANGQSDVGDVVLAITAAGQVNSQVSGVYWVMMWAFDALKVTSRYLNVLDRAYLAMEGYSSTAALPARVESGIAVRGVSFTYPGTATEVLRDIDLALPAGQTVALVGENGAGKTTLVKLLCGLYRPTSGAISVDGVSLADVSPADWRARLSAGFQDFAKYEFMADQVVGVGDLPRLGDRAAVVAALDKAGGAEIVDRLPNGLDSLLGRRFEAGSEISGGQWQKLALGRAMMRESPLLLVLDEPTAALDADTEHALFVKYAEAAKATAAETGAITVLVSHRFSTVKMADLIVVLEGGRVIELGSHEELMAREGAYAELFNLQARAYR